MSYQRDYDRRIKIGIVGVGSHCYRNILPTMNFLPVEIRAVCDINEGLARKTAKQYGCTFYTNTKEMYDKEKLDAVFISVGPRLHPKLSIEALDAGLHVWVEKPLAMRAFEVQEIIEHRRDRIVVVGFKKAFMPVMEKAKEIVYSEKYGNLKSMLGIYPMSIPSNGEQVLKEGHYTNWLANGVHPLSFLMELGGRVESVVSHCRDDGHGVFVINFKNGIIGNLQLASGPLPMETYYLYGDKWYLRIYNNNRVELQRGIPFDYSRTTSFLHSGDDTGAVVWEAQNCLASLENKAIFTQGFFNEMKYFCDCILEEKKPEKGTLEFAYEMMKVYEAGLLSKGKIIYLN